MMSVMTAREGCGDDVEHVVTLRVYYETQGEETSFVPNQPDRWLDIIIMYVTCAVARAAAGRQAVLAVGRACMLVLFRARPINMSSAG